MKSTALIISTLSLVFSAACQSKEHKVKPTVQQDKDSIPHFDSTESTTRKIYQVSRIDRTEIQKSLSDKKENNETLIVHALVPLCDNENQGIVPTSTSLGNGMSLRTNLYWATRTGVKRFFKDHEQWILLKSELDHNEDILERVYFKHSTKNMILIADAYRGDRMHECLNDYFNLLSGNLNEELNDSLSDIKHPDLCIFNGHNGLMDEETNYTGRTITPPIDAVSISCISNDYFKEHYEQTGSYPLVLTSGLMYPGAFVMDGIIEAWSNGSTPRKCKEAAGKMYYKYKPESGPNGSQNLFKYGW